MIVIDAPMPKSCAQCDLMFSSAFKCKAYLGSYHPDVTRTRSDNCPIKYEIASKPTGHWIIEKWNNKEHYSCSSCQHVVDYEPCYHYCPYCGAKMIEPQESEG